MNVSGRASRLFEHLGRIARAASVRPTGETAVTPIGCRRRPGRKPCTGETITARHLRHPERARAALGPRAVSARLLLFGAEFDAAVRKVAGGRPDVELVDLARPYDGE